jgi:hypothetical protein
VRGHDDEITLRLGCRRDNLLSRAADADLQSCFYALGNMRVGEGGEAICALALERFIKLAILFLPNPEQTVIGRNNVEQYQSATGFLNDTY